MIPKIKQYGKEPWEKKLICPFCDGELTFDRDIHYGYNFDGLVLNSLVYCERCMKYRYGFGVRKKIEDMDGKDSLSLGATENEIFDFS